MFICVIKIWKTFWKPVSTRLKYEISLGDGPYNDIDPGWSRLITGSLFLRRRTLTFYLFSQTSKLNTDRVE